MTVTTYGTANANEEDEMDSKIIIPNPYQMAALTEGGRARVPAMIEEIRARVQSIIDEHGDDTPGTLYIDTGGAVVIRDADPPSMWVSDSHLHKAGKSKRPGRQYTPTHERDTMRYKQRNPFPKCNRKGCNRELRYGGLYCSSACVELAKEAGTVKKCRGFRFGNIAAAEGSIC